MLVVMMDRLGPSSAHGHLRFSSRTNIQLPECLRIMGYLRRIAAFSEAELRLQFLQCRDEWVSQLVDDLDSSDSYEYMKHLTDVHRLHLFDAVMQYRAIFFDNPAPSQVSVCYLSRGLGSLGLCCGHGVVSLGTGGLTNGW